MKKILLLFIFLSLPLLSNIDSQIEAIQKAPVSERFKLMNAFKKELIQMQEKERIHAMSKLQSITHSKHASKAFRVRQAKEYTREELRPNMSSNDETEGNVENTTEESVENETEQQTQNETEDSVQNETEHQTQNETEESVENEIEHQTQNQTEDSVQNETENHIEHVNEEHIENETEERNEEEHDDD